MNVVAVCRKILGMLSLLKNIVMYIMYTITQNVKKYNAYNVKYKQGKFYSLQEC